MNKKDQYMKQCPKFYSCNAPICPLDPDMNLRVKFPEDETCKMEKSVRIRIGKDLPNQGKTKKELAEEAKWKKRGLVPHSEMPFRRVKK